MEEASLLWVNGPDGARPITIDREGVVGRSGECDVRIVAEGVSRRHARIERVGQGFLVRDLGSTNGVFVNGVRVEEALAKPGDEILLGRALFRVRATASGSSRDVSESAGETIHVVLDAASVRAPAEKLDASRARRQLDALHHLLEETSRTADPDDVLETAARLLAEATGASAAFVVLGGDASAAPFLGHTRGCDAPTRPSRTLLSAVLERGEAILAHDPAGGGPFSSSESVAAASGFDVLAAPISHAGRSVGALYLAARSGPRRLDEGDLRFVTLAARQIAQAVERCRRESGFDLDREAARRETDLLAQGLVVRSEAMAACVELARRAAKSRATVLLIGETGTGKELLARAVHAWSSRERGPFVPVNCGALPDTLVESELFGHERGAFTGADRRRIGRFEAAHGGTLFLDEVGELDPGAQVKLLRVLEEGRVRRLGGSREVAVDVRVVAATHRDLDEAVRERRFRADLLYRLRVVEIRVPPLRERPDDVLPIARHVLERLGRGLGRGSLALSADAERRLLEYPWPGNVRELRNVLERAAILSAADTLAAEDLGLPTKEERSSSDAAVLRRLRDVERDHIVAVLRAVGGSRRRAAEILGIGRTSLYEKMRRMAISEEEFR